MEEIPEVVLVAGGDERVWPSATHAHAIAARRHVHGLDTVVVTDPGAGHRAIVPGEPAAAGGMRMASGGTGAADRRLGRSAWAHLSRLL